MPKTNPKTKMIIVSKIQHRKATIIIRISALIKALKVESESFPVKKLIVNRVKWKTKTSNKTKIKYFDTTVFYRVAKGFVIQGGNSDDEYTMKQRNKYGNYLMKPEFLPHRKHKYGALAAARHWENNPNKLSSPFEFYIVHNRNGAHHLNNEHTVFGEVISGYSVMDKISKVDVGVDEWPKVDIKMKVEIIN